MENKNRVLAYNLAKEISLEEITEVTGGTGSPNNWHVTYSVTGVPGGPASFDVGIESD